MANLDTDTTPYVIQLFARPLPDGNCSTGDYCGSYHIPCPDGDPIISRLEIAGVGRALNEDGTITRGVFFYNELSAIVARAKQETQCEAYIEFLRED